jgi:hypothetical protein
MPTIEVTSMESDEREAELLEMRMKRKAAF